MNIRVATLDDLDFLLDVSHELILFEKSLGANVSCTGVKESEFKADLAKRLLLSDEFLYLIAEYEGEKIGFLAGEVGDENKWWKYKKFSYLNYLFIYEKYRKQGYGKQLIGEFEKWSKSKGADFMNVESVAENTSAVGLYHQLGFRSHLINLGKKL